MFISKFAYGYSYVFRGTPLLVQIFIIYFGLGQIEYLRSTFLWVILKEPYWCAIIAFALNTGAYTSEILRSAFQTIKPGIIEAGKSLGISNKIIFNGYEVKTKINWGSKVKFRHPDPNKFNAKLTNDEDVVLDRITGKLSFPASSSDHDHIFYKPFVCQKSKALF